jgi:DNA polymerase-3 subunit delta'
MFSRYDIAMSDLLLHKSTKQVLRTYLKDPSHALLLIAPSGSGKGSITRLLASELLQISDIKLLNHPYFKLIKPDDRQVISIDTIREIIHFTTLKTTSKSIVDRVIVIEDSQKMTIEAQNALLKTIEEPPKGTALILTAPNQRFLIPTILSRLQILNLSVPDKEEVIEHFKNKGFQTTDINHAIMLSGGLIGLMQAILDKNTEHPLIEATNFAHHLLTKTTFNKLLVIDELAKDKHFCQDVIYILEQMANLSLSQSNKNPDAFKRWHKILQACHLANKQILANSQLKLVLLNFMLSL